MATSKLRLLDLALSYALDNPGIHQNDAGNIARLRDMHANVLGALVVQDMVSDAEAYLNQLLRESGARPVTRPDGSTTPRELQHLVIPLGDTPPGSKTKSRPATTHLTSVVEPGDELFDDVPTGPTGKTFTPDPRIPSHQCFASTVDGCVGELQRFILKQVAWGWGPGDDVVLCVGHARRAHNNGTI